MLAGLLVLAHVAMVFWLVAGMVGRGTCYAQAGRATDLAALRAMVALGSLFERSMVRPATFGVLATGLAAAWARGWPILGFLEGATVNWVLAALLVYLGIIPVIVFIFLPRGRVYQAALDEATPQGAVTPALRSALNDPLVAVGRAYEMVMAAVLTWLMVMKPF